MTAGLAPPRSAGPQGGQAAAVQVDPQELVNGYLGLFNAYSQVEQNQKIKAETEHKLSVMVDKLRGGALHDLTQEKLQALMHAIQEGNGQRAQQAFGDITRKCWADVKEFSNALKTLASSVRR